ALPDVGRALTCDLAGALRPRLAMEEVDAPIAARHRVSGCIGMINVRAFDRDRTHRNLKRGSCRDVPARVAVEIDGAVRILLEGEPGALPGSRAFGAAAVGRDVRTDVVALRADGVDSGGGDRDCGVWVGGICAGARRHAQR